MRVIHLLSNKVWGGGEQYALDLMQALRTAGHSVKAVTRPLPAITGRLQQSGIGYTTMRLGGAWDMGSACRLARVLNADRQDTVVHVHNFKDAFTAAFARLLSRRKNIRIVMTRHLVKPAKNTRPYRWLYGQIDVLIFVSRLAQQAFLSTQPNTNTDRMTVVHNAIRIPDTVQPADLHSLYGIPQGRTIVMCHGRLSPEKGIEHLLDAITKAHTSTHLVIVGSGLEAYTRSLRDTVQTLKLNDRVTFAGFQDKIFPLIAAADIGVMPSVAQESFGLAALEYMAMGKPVITTDNGAQSEFITDGQTGLLVPPANPSALAQAINRLDDDAALRHRLGTAAQKKVSQQLGYDTFFAAITAVYNGVSSAK